jgi:hypothetical protein
MRLRPNLHDLYVGRVVLVTVLLVWAVLVGLDVVNALATEVGDLGKGSYTFGHAVAYVAYTVPRRAYTMFPTSAVIGALMGLGQLATSSELIALRAVGLSRRRLSVSVAITLALLTGLMVFGMETVGTWGQTQADNLKTSATSKNLAVAKYSGLWAREGNVFLNARDGVRRETDGQEWTERGGRPNHHGADRGGDRGVNVEPSDPPVQRGATGAQSRPDLRHRSHHRHACEHHVGHQQRVQRVVQPERRGHPRATRDVGRQRVGQECDDDYGEGGG